MDKVDPRRDFCGSKWQDVLKSVLSELDPLEL